MWKGVLIKQGSVKFGPKYQYSKSLAEKEVQGFSGRCQVFMSRETKAGSFLSFSVAVLLYPYQEEKVHEIPHNYKYSLYDSERTPISIKGCNLRFTIELTTYRFTNGDCGFPTKFCKDVQLSGDMFTRADFIIKLNSSTEVWEGAVLGELIISNGEISLHTMNLIKVCCDIAYSK